MAVSKRKNDGSAAKAAVSTDTKRLSAMVGEGEGPRWNSNAPPAS